MSSLFLGGIFLPLFGFILIGGFGRFFGRKGSMFISVVTLLLCVFVFYIEGFRLVWEGSSMFVLCGAWIFDGISWGFIFDTMSLEMCFLISTITFCVMLYSAEYMYHDAHVVRFLSFLSLFAFFMLFLVTSSSFLQMFIGWEGVGFVSFLLINFWFMRLEANRSAIKAMLFNRVGDSFYLLGLVFLFYSFKTTDLVIISNLGSFGYDNYVVFSCCNVNFCLFDVILGLFFLAAMGKSAQLGLHAWLPDAMEGPTPVSSLLHSATMVTAGVFLVGRLSHFFFYSSCVCSFILFIGALTASLNAIFGFFQNDLKKIIAFSTCSQLGIMFVGMASNSTVGFYHLVNHGFFKALLFLSAGSVIHAVGGEQDVRRMGGLYSYMPFTTLCMFVGSMSLTGFPFLSGYYSKEFILFTLYSSVSFFDKLIFILIFFASFFTICYSIKIMLIVFYSVGFFNSKVVLQSVHEPCYTMLLAMFILVLFAISFGFFNEELFNSLGSTQWVNLLSFSEVSLNNFLINFFNVEVSNFGSKWFLVFIFLFLLALALLVNSKNNEILFLLSFVNNSFLLFLFWLFSNRMGFVSIYKVVTKSFLFVGYRITFLLIDRGLLELIGPAQVVRFSYFLCNIIASENITSFANVFAFVLSVFLLSLIICLCPFLISSVFFCLTMFVVLKILEN